MSRVLAARAVSRERGIYIRMSRLVCAMFGFRCVMRSCDFERRAERFSLVLWVLLGFEFYFVICRDIRYIGMPILYHSFLQNNLIQNNSVTRVRIQVSK